MTTSLSPVLAKLYDLDSQVIFLNLNEEPQELLENIAIETDGIVFPLDSLSVENAISDYNQFLTMKPLDTVAWSFPYLDAAGLGMVITASAPVRIDTNLIGVVGVDITLNSFINEIKEIKPLDVIETFVFDLGGISVLHSDFEDIPVDEWSPEVTRLAIEEYETYNSDFIRLKEKAKAGESAVDTVKYSTGKKIVAMSPIGNTSMILSFSGNPEELAGEEIMLKLDTLKIDIASIFPSIFVGVITSIILYPILSRKFLSTKTKEGGKSQ